MPVTTAPLTARRPGPHRHGGSGLRPALRRILSLALVAPLVLVATPALAATPDGSPSPSEGPQATRAAAATTSFSDAPPGTPYFEGVTWLAQNGITTGYADGTFGVGDDVSRAQASAFLYRLMDEPTTPPTDRFLDVPADSRWNAPVSWMVQEGIVSGYADGTFLPDRSITRGEMAKILFGVGASDGYTPGSESQFTDVNTKDPLYRYIAWMKSAEISNGYANGTYQPSRPISRGESAKLIRAVAGELGHDTTVVPTKVPTNFEVTGSGFGHGVGMSQYGARAMAAGGSSAAQILSHYYSPAAMGQASALADRDISVHLVSTKKIAVGGTDRVRVRASGSTQLPETTGAVTFTVDGDHVVATYSDRDGKRAEKRSGSVALEWTGTRFWEPKKTSTVTVPDANGTSTDLVLRHGRLVVTVNGDGELNVVTQLRMDDEYLYGLAEMPSLWPSAALQAQAIAGRSYALRYMRSLRPACDCHVWDETNSQKFTGWAKENEGPGGVYGARWTAAVDATSKRALIHNGSVADASYHSSSAGRTRGAEEQWSNAVPYLTSKADPYSLTDANPNRSWTQTVTQNQVAQAFGLDDVHTLKETAVNKNSGYTDRMTATATNGKTSWLTGNQFRSRLGLKSAFISKITPR